ncbi:protein phosphatase methylesterase 1-like, partial [Tropilaelaps mercedesae]
MSSLQREVLRSKLPPAAPGPSGPPPARKGRRDYTPVKGDKYFSQEQEVQVDSGDIFKIYRCASADCPPERPVLFLLHGAGYSGLTWACFAAEIVSMVECSLVAMDLRGHGESTAADETNLSAETMVHDIGQVYQKLYEGSENRPPVILIGHSMGGALAVHVAAAGSIPEISGLVVIDVVEGTALDALKSMQAVLRARPRSFHSLENAVEWSCRSGQTRNIDAAKVSMPAMLKRLSDGVPGTKLIGLSQKYSPIVMAEGAGGDTPSFVEGLDSDAVIPEDEEADSGRDKPIKA